MNEVAEGPVAGTPAVVPAAAALDAATATGTTGQRLKAARERRGLSSQKAADKMHLDLWVIEALESDQFDKIGPSVYAKGHLKRYAGILGLPAAEIMAAYGAPPAEVAPQRGAMRLRTQEPVGIELPWGTIATAALAAVVISGVVWLRPWRSRSSAAPPPTAAQAGPRQSGPRQAESSAAYADAPVDDAGAETQDDGPTTADTGAPVATAVPVAAVPAAHTVRAAAPATAAGAGTPPATAAAPPPGAGKAQLRLSFSADSWVEVHDAADKPVFAGNGRANSVKSVAGDAPLRVYLRSASGVQLTINNRVVAIGPQFVAGDVARFEAGADGVLRRDSHTTSSSAAAHEPRPHG